MRLTRVLALLALAIPAATGCIISSPPPGGPGPDNDAPGDISFNWSFEGETRCSAAGVTDIDIQIFGPSETLVFQDTVECIGGGLTLRDFEPGRHEILLDAYDRGTLVYLADTITLDVRGGRDNDLGTVEFVRPGNNVGTGSIASFWSFKYPTDESQVIDCAIAGVDDVFVEITPLSGSASPFTQTFACASEGFVVDGMGAGDYEVTFLALGSYDGTELPLYSSTVTTTIFAGSETDLGDVNLDRIFDSFGDIEISWGFGAGDCASRGVSEIEVSITRVGSEIRDDLFTAPCDTISSVRRTFVPGGYVVTATGTGSGNVGYIGTRTLDLAPNTQSSASLELVLAGN